VGAEGWADRGTARAVLGQDSEWGVAEARAAGELAVELEALAVQGAVGLAAPACGILARPAVAKARVGPAAEVAPEADLAVVQAEELAGLAEAVRELAVV